jgi:hypothetical protein
MLTQPFSLSGILKTIGGCFTGANAERGVASFVAAMIALAVTGTTAAAITVAAEDINFDGLEAMVDSGIARASGTLETRGSIIGRTDDGSSVSAVQLPLRLYGDGNAITLDPADPDRLVIAFYDSDTYNPDVAFTVEPLTGNGDDVLDPWETVLVTIDVSGFDLTDGERFTLELSSAAGGTLILQRTLPPILQDVMSLY